MRKQYQKAWSKAEIECREPGHYLNYTKTWHLCLEYLKHDEVYQELKKKYNTDNNLYWCYPDRYKLAKKATKMLKDLKWGRAV